MYPEKEKRYRSLDDPAEKERQRTGRFWHVVNSTCALGAYYNKLGNSQAQSCEHCTQFLLLFGLLWLVQCYYFPFFSRHFWLKSGKHNIKANHWLFQRHKWRSIDCSVTDLCGADVFTGPRMHRRVVGNAAYQNTHYGTWDSNMTAGHDIE